jgi:hypothetical protein
MMVRPMGLRQRISRVFGIKCPQNPITRICFVWYVFPWYAKISAAGIYCFRSLIEVILGARIRRLYAMLGSIQK